MPISSAGVETQKKCRLSLILSRVLYASCLLTPFKTKTREIPQNRLRNCRNLKMSNGRLKSDRKSYRVTKKVEKEFNVSTLNPGTLDSSHEGLSQVRMENLKLKPKFLKIKSFLGVF